MVSDEVVEEVLSRYMRLEEKTIKQIEEGDGTGVTSFLKDLTDFEKQKLKSKYEDRLKLLKEIHYDLLG